jgi:uncharacterized protein YcgI (DUF1989 family)
MATSELITIPAGHGKAARLNAGQKIKLINTHGTQVVDCFAFNAYDLTEYMSMESSRVYNTCINPNVGHVFVTNQRRPILTLIEDTSPGIHDTLCAACDRHRYKLLGIESYHRNCQDNTIEGMMELGVTPPFPVAGSWNVFMNIPIGDDRNSFDFQPTDCKPGDYVVMEAQMDCFVAFSSCPQDVLPINGEGGAAPVDAHFQVLD